MSFFVYFRTKNAKQKAKPLRFARNNIIIISQKSAFVNTFLATFSNFCYLHKKLLFSSYNLSIAFPVFLCYTKDTEKEVRSNVHLTVKLENEGTRIDLNKEEQKVRFSTAVLRFT